MNLFKVMLLVCMMTCNLFASETDSLEFAYVTAPFHTAAHLGQPWPLIVDHAVQTLPQEGVLQMKSDGFVYLAVDPAYIHDLFPRLGLKRDGYREPPYFRRPDSPGAHISVIYSDEGAIPKEIGQTFHFKLNKIAVVHPSRWVSYVILEVDAPELEQLRKKYGLSPKLKGHEFHITLAKKQHRKNSYSEGSYDKKDRKEKRDKKDVPDLQDVQDN